MPWYVADDGKVYNQSDAILRALCAQHGYKSADPWCEFESEWTMETIFDFNKADGSCGPFFKGDAEATEEMKTKSSELICKLFDSKLQFLIFQ